MKILFIGFSHSIHSVNWLKSIDAEKNEIHFFPSQACESIHEDFPRVIYHSDYNQIAYESIKTTKVIHKVLNPILGKLKSKNKIIAKCIRAIYRIFGADRNHAASLRKVIKKEQPDLIHILETQNSGYLYLEANTTEIKQKLFLSIWGIDLHYFGILPEHTGKIKDLLSKVDHLLVEGKRDIQLAEQLKYDKTFQIIQATGGLDFQLIDEIRKKSLDPSKRKALCIKGSQNLVRRALFAVAAIKHVAKELEGWEVFIYSCDDVVRNECIGIKENYGIDIQIIGAISQKDMLELFSRCRISLIINRSDGVSNSLLESIAVGCFPIISNTSCADDFIKHSQNGYIVEYDDTKAIETHLLKAISNPEMVEKAERINYEIVKNQFNRDVLGGKINMLYR